jgi:hypothetical protein
MAQINTVSLLSYSSPGRFRDGLNNSLLECLEKFLKICPMKPIIKSLAMTVALAVTVLSQPAEASDRHKWYWPFASDSIWNTSIGSDAVYTPATINGTPIGGFPDESVNYDHEYHVRVRSDHPLRNIYNPGSWCTRTTGTTLAWISSMLVPDWYNPASTVCTSTNYYTPNNAAAFLQPNGNDVIQIEPADRSSSTSPVYGYPQSSVYWTDMKLDGQGERGSHYGSSLSALGGSLRLGDLVGPAPIRHALKLNLWGSRYLYNGTASGYGAGWGYRWPARNADANAKNAISAGGYGGNNPNLAQGSLLAIPSDRSPEALGLESTAGRKLFRALQDYGAYIVDDTGWRTIAFDGEVGVPEEVQATYGMSMQGGFDDNAITRDIKKLLNNLNVVTNNAPMSKGGGGQQRAELAPTFAPGSRVGNFDFEESTEAPWTKYGSATAAIGYGRYGSKGIRIGPSSGYEQVISGLKPNTHYTVLAAARVESTGQSVNFGIKNYGSSQVISKVVTTSYTRKALAFHTGATNTSATVFFNKDSSMVGYGYGDELIITEGGVGTNLVNNASFDANNAWTQTPSSWSETYDTNASYADNQGGHSGSYFGKHYSSSSYSAYTSQTKTGLINGLYTLTAWVQSSGGQTNARMEAKNYGGSTVSAPIPATKTWTKITLSSINVTNGQVTFGFYSQASGGQWINFDDVQLTRE